MPAARVLLLALIAQTGSATALADTYPPDVVAVLSGENKNSTELSFVGRSGQVYIPQGQTWKRQHVGGIAADVIGAVKTRRGLYALSSRAPLFKRVAGVWQATPLANRGYTAFSSHGAVVAIALGRHIYQLDKSGWSRFATAARRVTALYPATKTRVYVATTRGRLRRTDGKSSTVIKNPLPTDDYVKLMLGRTGGDLYGVTKAGVILHIAGTTATVLALDPSMAGLTVHALGYGPKKAIYGVGMISAADGSKRSVIVEFKGQSVTEVAPLPALAADDRYSVVHTAKDGKLVVASFSGLVRIRAADGTWSERRVSGDAPPASAPASPPARSR